MLVDRSLQQQVLQLQSELEGRRAPREPGAAARKADELLRIKVESERALQQRVRALEAEAEKLRRVNRDLNEELLDLKVQTDEQLAAGRAASAITRES
jgi:hypothetical protein